MYITPNRDRLFLHCYYLSILKGEVILSKVQIKVNNNGSLRVTGDVELVDAAGNTFDTKQTFSLCRCGLSEKKPFCDGAHKGNFESIVSAK